MKRALCVGINYYENQFTNDLNGCVNDARRVQDILVKNGDEGQSKNFDVKVLTSKDSRKAVTKRLLKESIEELFKNPADVALLYFSGHGGVIDEEGYLITSDSNDAEEGLQMSWLLKCIEDSPVPNKLVILDCCQSGKMAETMLGGSVSRLCEGVTILTASDKHQYAVEEGGKGLFTNLLLDALEGSAADLMGHITPASVYAHIDQSLGSWSQRPIFKTNTRTFVSLREVKPTISMADLKKITELFAASDEHHSLDPSYEPEREPVKENCPDPDPAKNEKFRILQQMNRLNLVVPVDAPHMWHAAMDNKACKLTFLGKHYWNLVNKDRL
ncbi:MAG: caspase family protein [Cyclobacteriaceae bacterium]